jgi:hypothetical protein
MPPKKQAPVKEPPKKKKTKEAPIKECEKSTAERVKELLKPRKPKKKEKQINPADLRFFTQMSEANKRKFIPPERSSDYDRQIMKSYDKKKKSGSSSSDVP